MGSVRPLGRQSYSFHDTSAQDNFKTGLKGNLEEKLPVGLAKWAMLQFEFPLPQKVQKHCWRLHHPCAAGDTSSVLRDPHTPLQAS